MTPTLAQLRKRAERLARRLLGGPVANVGCAIQSIDRQWNARAYGTCESAVGHTESAALRALIRKLAARLRARVKADVKALEE